MQISSRKRINKAYDIPIYGSITEQNFTRNDVFVSDRVLIVKLGHNEQKYTPWTNTTPENVSSALAAQIPLLLCIEFIAMYALRLKCTFPLKKVKRELVLKLYMGFQRPINEDKGWNIMQKLTKHLFEIWKCFLIVVALSNLVNPW